MAEAKTTGGSRSVAHIGSEVEDYDEDGFVGEAGQNAGETAVTIDGFTFRDEPQADATVSVEQPLPRQRRCSICGQLGHTARTCTAEGASNAVTRASRKPTKEAVGAVAPMLVGTLNFCAISTFGPSCGLTDMEGKLLIPSVQRMMERLPAATAQKAAIFLDPLIIVTVFVMWGKRIVAIKQAEAHAKFAVEPFERMRASGASGTEYSVPANGVPTESVSNSVAAGYQQTNGAARTANNGHVTPPEGVTDEATYGVPNQIRSAFDDNF